MPRKLMVSASTACSVCEMTSPMPSLASAVLLLEVLDVPPHTLSCRWNWPSSPWIVRMSKPGLPASPARIFTTWSTESFGSSDRRRANIGVTKDRKPAKNARTDKPPHKASAHGDDPQAEASRQGDGRIDDRHVVGAVAYAANERSVQFQRMHGKALEIVEGRIAGAEVVDGETDAQGAQRLEHGLGVGVLADHHALGDFQLEARRRNRRLGEHP